jgi:hypothetical protein
MRRRRLQHGAIRKEAARFVRIVPLLLAHPLEVALLASVGRAQAAVRRAEHEHELDHEGERPVSHQFPGTRETRVGPSRSSSAGVSSESTR